MGTTTDHLRLLGRDREVRSFNPLLVTGGGGQIEVIGSGQIRIGQGTEAPQVEEDELVMGKDRNKLRVSYQSSIHPVVPSLFLPRYLVVT
jgi:hypothetical protein